MKPINEFSETIINDFATHFIDFTVDVDAWNGCCGCGPTVYTINDHGNIQAALMERSEKWIRQKKPADYQVDHMEFREYFDPDYDIHIDHGCLRVYLKPNT